MRAFVVAIAIILFSTHGAFAADMPGRVAFDVFRNGQPFGTHIVEVSRAGETLRVETRADLRARLGPVTVFHYSQTCSEMWASGALTALDCTMLRNGRRVRVMARRENDGLRVTGRGATLFPANALPTSWWTRPPNAITAMIDTETGARMPLRVTDLARETIDIGGTRIAADHVRVQGTLTVDLWYDSSGRWVGCAFTARGQRITYRLTTPISAAPA